MGDVRSDSISSRGKDRNSRDKVLRIGTLIPIKMSPSPYCPGPLLKHRNEDCAAWGDASDLSFCLIFLAFIWVTLKEPSTSSSILVRKRGMCDFWDHFPRTSHQLETCHLSWILHGWTFPNRHPSRRKKRPMPFSTSVTSTIRFGWIPSKKRSLSQPLFRKGNRVRSPPQVGPAPRFLPRPPSSVTFLRFPEGAWC